MNVVDICYYFNKIVEAAQNGKLLLMPDQDGATLNAPIGQHTGFLPETGLQADYECLISAGNIVVPNTGRPRDFLAAAYPQLHDRMWQVCETGAVVFAPGGERVYSAVFPEREKILDDLGSIVTEYEGVIIETGKVCAITIGITNAREREKSFERLLRYAKDIASQYSGLHIKFGHAAHNTHIEIVPVGVDKGAATEMMCSIAGERLFVCLGDGDPDADMMRVVNDRGGISIGVGSGAPRESHFVLPDYKQAQNFIHSVAASLG